MEKLNRLKIVLVEKGFTGRALAEKIGMNEVTISKWCRNAQQPDIKTLYEVAKILDVDVCDLLVRENENK